ncbi:hypothetical protein ZOD2009_21627 [Haladaptatus paucihalophilus DX253]|uniref:Uncharacterized protein n=1 Tax=Haladaptatus paucihalophilus DX253 TaxID=797209 RepID=E7QZT2_HALPU|nr:hypothetical protein [Haladaptatus paucihalophilus]EFW89826.1 hypothetical protein ZOD2009_21627 [Haladaptatus paucihalophilus DX253]SHK55378.1 hypothetical protein SAMN05444342_1653 [Haladaptatus paucihalophilus DX253]
MAEESVETAPTTGSPDSKGARDADEETLVGFVYTENMNILGRRKRESQQQNEKAANLIRLLGVIFTLYSGAILVVARISAKPSNSGLKLGLFVNEYTVLCLAFLAAAFLYAVLAYHRTSIASGPSAEYLRNEISEETSVEDAKREINKKVPGWVRNNDNEIELDHTRLFNCKMCIFFSLLYFVVGSVLASEISTLDTMDHLLMGGVMVAITYVVYDHVRDRASNGAND